ncbi:TPA: hypothetical protein EYP37_08050 [Candidatus Poribacteria bacterium]|nr:hypothetical protein [Candidatus Poribacteria bacterium]
MPPKFALFRKEHNDFDLILEELGIDYDLLPHETLADWPFEEWELSDYDALIICSEHFPQPTRFRKRALERIASFLKQGKSLYLEYASPLTQEEVCPKSIDFQRLFVVKDHYLTRDLELGAILDAHRTFYFPAAFPDQEEILSLARICGTFQKMGDALDELVPVFSVVFRYGGRIIYSGVEMSCFTTKLYRPTAHWERLLRRIVLFLIPEELRADYEERTSSISVCKREACGEKISPKWSEGERREKYRIALERNLRWYRSSGVMPDPTGTKGVYEQVHSDIDCFGRQRVVEWYRPDCNAQSALAFYLVGRALNRGEDQQTGLNIIEFLLAHRFQDLDLDHETYGFWSWWEMKRMQKYAEAIYGDDNSWPAFALLKLYQMTGRKEYLERGLLTTEALLVTQGIGGLRHARLNGVEVNQRGKAWYTQQNWEDAWGGSSPHYGANVLAVFFYVYGLTGDKRYLSVAEEGLSNMIRRYLDKSYTEWVTSHTAEHARFLLALASGCHYSERTEFRNALKEVCDFLMAHQVACGAIQEWDNPNRNTYGTAETGVFCENGEPISDQLYCTSFAALGLWTVYKSTSDKTYLDAFRRLTDYLVHIQVRSGYPRTDGGWMRGFDFEHWEYYGASGDIGWGAYAMETGWTNAIIDTALAFYLLDDSFLCLKGQPDIIAGDLLQRIRAKR